MRLLTIEKNHKLNIESREFLSQELSTENQELLREFLSQHLSLDQHTNHKPDTFPHQWEEVQSEEVQPEEELRSKSEIKNKTITEYMDFLSDYALTSLK